jgi:hypothetical protein
MEDGSPNRGVQYRRSGLFQVDTCEYCSKLIPVNMKSLTCSRPEPGAEPAHNADPAAAYILSHRDGGS